QAARAARRFPGLFSAIEGGRLHLSAVCFIAPHLTADNLEELLGAATHRRKFEVERWLAERFAQPFQQGIAPQAEAVPPLAPGQGGAGAVEQRPPLAPGQVDPPGSGGAMELAPGQVAATPGASPCARLVVRLSLSTSTHDKLRRAQALLS